jgi:NitT/TauT family transport system substrate-binding protein
VKIGYLPLMAAGPLFVAVDRGYLTEAGLDAEMVPFNAGAEMVAALGTGELAAGYAAVSPALLNAWARDIRTLALMDLGRFRPGYGTILLVVRSDLADTIQSAADLRGRRVALGVLGGANDYVIRNFLNQNGLSLDDVDGVRLPSPDVNAGLAGRSLDAAVVSEPFGALVEQSGIGRRWVSGDAIVPGMQLATLLVSEAASRDRAQCVELVAALLQGVRDFLPGQTSDPDLLAIVNRWSNVAPEVIRRSTPTWADPNGALDVDDLGRQQAFWLRAGLVNAAAPVAERVDPSIVEAALQLVGRVGS